MLINPRTLNRLPHRLITILGLLLQIEILSIRNNRLSIRPRGDLHAFGIHKGAFSVTFETRKLQCHIGNAVQGREDVLGKGVPGLGGHDGGAHGAWAEGVDADVVCGFEMACYGAEKAEDGDCGFVLFVSWGQRMVETEGGGGRYVHFDVV